MLLAVQIALCGLGGALAALVVEECFRAYLDPALVMALTSSLFLCQ